MKEAIFQLPSYLYWYDCWEIIEENGICFPSTHWLNPSGIHLVNSSVGYFYNSKQERGITLKCSMFRVQSTSVFMETPTHFINKFEIPMWVPYSLYRKTSVFIDLFFTDLVFHDQKFYKHFEFSNHSLFSELYLKMVFLLKLHLNERNLGKISIYLSTRLLASPPLVLVSLSILMKAAQNCWAQLLISPYPFT